ncbi:methionine ABC transporter permease [Longispora fulva]|uniref:D-methionine transport system permease protein n=1 Tax=Longispora fulva TaxID=619741 RepID=A0A8J7KMF7_9ACTN|nr:methionine ABC transporter permease [Longispora fulva]MBG6140434.1 D-methionine transport system permease protein [Longispora fulva]GIG57185.1 methionine ABC transporter permease [Longispora fulva]
MIELLWPATLETLYMVSVASVVAVLGGIPLGVLLARAPKPVYTPVSLVGNATRSLPFIILLLLLDPVTRAVTGKGIGAEAAMVPLSIGAIPFFARLVENSIREIDPGLVEAGRSLGMRSWTLVTKVLLPEALPSLVRGVTVTVVAIVGYSAMAGVVGGGGLGDLAIRWGHERFRTDVLLATAAVLIVLVQGIQSGGDLLAKRLDRR